MVTKQITLSSASVSWRSLEKLLAYGAATVGATNGFAQVSMPASVREWLVIGAAFIVGALHLSGPAATPNTSTSPTVVKKAVVAEPVPAPIAPVVPDGVPRVN